jgi:hypothetical protein
MPCGLVQLQKGGLLRGWADREDEEPRKEKDKELGRRLRKMGTTRTNSVTEEKLRNNRNRGQQRIW